MNKGYAFALAGVIFSLAINAGIAYYLFKPPTFGFNILTSLSGLGLTGIAFIPLIVWVLVCKYLFSYTDGLLNWILLPSFIMLFFYILVPFIPI